MTIGEWLRHAEETLQESGCPDWQLDGKWIAEDTLRMTRADLRFESSRALDDAALRALNEQLRRRAQGEPVQYILERADFMGLQFHVDARVLIPRQDTETLVEAAIIELKKMPSPQRALDLCTGSGAIGLSLKTLVPTAEITLTDISRDALEVAKMNARALNADVHIRHGDLFQAVGRERFDMIASNPPYIPRGELTGLQREVRREPQLALDGGADGLALYRRIAEGLRDHLNPGGIVLLEVGAGQAASVLQCIQEHLDCAQSGIINDLNGIPRVVWARSV